jgi:ribonucleoside-diphosphate reductase alpha chain
VDSSLKTASEPAYLVSSDNPVLAPAYKGSDFASSAYQSGKQLADICPSCGAMALVYEEGCVKCHACGHSEC